MVPPNDTFLYELEDDLHDLCQPLTALQFRLELGKSLGDATALREAVDGALEETTRMIDSIKRMRQRLMETEASSASAYSRAHQTLGSNM
jgi:signal transduction histidine kinase